MKLFKDGNDVIYAYELDGSQDHLIGNKTPITQEEADQIKADKAAAAYAALSYAEKRRQEYPAIGDQLDALWKGGAEAEAMLAKVQAVKTKYPKV
jgi:hypothetical protein